MKHFSRKFGWVFAITVVLLFLFPLPSGSFTATHGPTTALRAAARVAALFATMITFFSAAISLIAVRRLVLTETILLPDILGDSSLQLRC
jgi:hypothetical protein